MLIQRLSQQVQTYFSSFYNGENRLAQSMLKTAEKLNEIAVPAVLLIAFSNIPGAVAGPLLYGICVSACTALATPVLLPACIIACIGPGLTPLP